MQDISGFWAGTYSYPNPTFPRVKFDCELGQTGSTLTGHITEVDPFKPSGFHMLSATLTGEIEGNRVSFLKTYINASEDYAAPVHYVGKISLMGRRITGRWSIPEFHGTFVMTRDKGKRLKLKPRVTANDRSSERA